MAFRRKVLPKSNLSTLDAELELSSSDEEEDETPVPMQQKDDGLHEDDNSQSSTEAHSSNQHFFLDATAGSSKSTQNQNPTFSKNEPGEGELEDGEINYDAVPSGKLSLKTGSNVNYGDDVDMDLDELCRQRNILPPPRRHQHRFHHDRPITGAWGKFYKVDPRQNLSLDEIIKMTPSVAMHNQPIRQRQQFANKVASKETLISGVDTIAENHPNRMADIYKDAMQMAGETAAEWKPDPWQFVGILISNGYSIYWRLMKRKDWEILAKEDESRLYRCIVIYNHVQGICEASIPVQAKHGAAVDFLQKMIKEYPLLSMGKFPMKVDDVLLLYNDLLKNLIKTMKEKHGPDYKVQYHVESKKGNRRTLYTCTLLMDSAKFEGYSYISEMSAKLLAAKSAYENLLKEPCPMMPIHIGNEQCTGDQSLYKGAETEMIHCYDFSRATILDNKENLHTSLATAAAKKGYNPFRNHKHNPRKSKCIQVSFVDPRKQNGNGNL